MTKRQSPLRAAIGKTVKSASISSREASDGCTFSILEIGFTDGSQLSFRMVPQLFVGGMFFVSDKDDSTSEVALVKP